MATKPRGRARRWSPAKIDELAAADSLNTDEPRERWRKDAPAQFRYLLDADPPFETERRAPSP